MTRQIQLLVASTMPRKAVPGRGVLEPSVTRMRVRPGDLDFYLHVNNGVYLQMMDVARSNFIADLGGFPLLKDKGWYPVVAASTMKYRRSLQLGDRFEITTRVLGWDERVVYLEQVFSRRGDLCARGLSPGASSRAGRATGSPRPSSSGSWAATSPPPSSRTTSRGGPGRSTSRTAADTRGALYRARAGCFDGSVTADREHDHPAADPFDATMVPALPCQDIDELRDFWTALGFDVTYRQLRPNPYLAVRRGGVDIHYFGLDGLAPQDSYSTCIVVVDDTAPVFEALAAGLRARYGRLPLTGFPRITRPRRRANAGGTTGFSLVDPAGNWVQVMRRSPLRTLPRTPRRAPRATPLPAPTPHAPRDGSPGRWTTPSCRPTRTATPPRPARSSRGAPARQGGRRRSRPGAGPRLPRRARRAHGRRRRGAHVPRRPRRARRHPRPGGARRRRSRARRGGRRAGGAPG